MVYIECSECWLAIAFTFPVVTPSGVEAVEEVVVGVACHVHCAGTQLYHLLNLQYHSGTIITKSS